MIQSFERDPGHLKSDTVQLRFLEPFGTKFADMVHDILEVFLF